MKSRKQLVKLLRSDWLGAGEKLVSYNGGDASSPYLGGVVGGAYRAPFEPFAPAARELDVDFTACPTPTAPVREGRIHGDEWVHDPSLRGWVLADSPQHDAVICANQLAAAGLEGWFVETDQRIAVIAEGSAVRGAEVAVEERTERSGIGGILGKARSAVNTVAEFAESLHGGEPLVTLWELPCDQLAELTGVRRGRWSESLFAVAARFQDGSVIELKRDRELPGL
ncbi:hypothetical protein [Saccharopolyspora mangrovi]|uniref:Uncharacterized protein n=1 Tax=Saccharopolyspora mangrovi TaxID=3082379 RepID=A0ABU6A7Y3_9PSEU|nr:hypothetical protein [Saccharopolyspora sp. S2-29]MEB3367563.1 hypothetical protein [Saccharopolyspora sp. S2-29]